MMANSDGVSDSVFIESARIPEDIEKFSPVTTSLYIMSPEKLTTSKLRLKETDGSTKLSREENIIFKFSIFPLNLRSTKK